MMNAWHQNRNVQYYIKHNHVVWRHKAKSIQRSTCDFFLFAVLTVRPMFASQASFDKCGKCCFCRLSPDCICRSSLSSGFSSPISLRQPSFHVLQICTLYGVLEYIDEDLNYRIVLSNRFKRLTVTEWLTNEHTEHTEHTLYKRRWVHVSDSAEIIPASSILLVFYNCGWLFVTFETSTQFTYVLEC